MKKLILTALVSSMLATTAYAGKAIDGYSVFEPDALSTASETVTKMSHGTLYVAGTFSGPDGLIGLNLVPTSKDVILEKPAIAWATPSGEYLLSGTVLNKDLEDVTALWQQKIMEQPLAVTSPVVPEIVAKPSIGVAMPLGSAEQVSGLNGVTLGEVSGSVITIVFDPACPHCRRQYEAITSEAGSLALSTAGISAKFVPVNLMNSSQLGAFILDQGTSGLRLVETKLITNDSDISVSDASLKAIKLNTSVASSLFPPQIPIVSWTDNYGTGRYAVGVHALDAIDVIINEIKGN